METPDFFDNAVEAAKSAVDSADKAYEWAFGEDALSRINVMRM